MDCRVLLNFPVLLLSIPDWSPILVLAASRHEVAAQLNGACNQFSAVFLPGAVRVPAADSSALWAGLMSLVQHSCSGAWATVRFTNLSRFPRANLHQQDALKPVRQVAIKIYVFVFMCVCLYV